MTDGLDFARNLLAAGVARGAPLLYAAVGESLAELSGVLNLGVEGMMLVGAVAGVGAAHATGSAWMGMAAAVLAGAALAAVHAVSTVVLRADEVVSGLAIVFLGAGLSSLAGSSLVGLGTAVPRLDPVSIPLLVDVPLLGPALFSHALPVYGAFATAVLAAFWVRRTRPGLALVACGENPDAAAAAGIPVRGLRIVYTLLGGAFAGVAGGTLSLSITPGWVEGMTAGQGWIALGLVVFARRDPGLAIAGAVLFGVVRRLPLDLQGTDVEVLRNPTLGFFLNMLPYLVTVGVLVVVRLRHRTAPGTAAICD